MGFNDAPGVKKAEKAPVLELSPEEQELFELQKEYWKTIDSISLPAFDPKTGILGTLKMVTKAWGEILSPRGIKLMLNDAKLNKLNTKYQQSKEGLTESEDSKQQGEERRKAQEEIDLAKENLSRAEEKLFSIVERQMAS